MKFWYAIKKLLIWVRKTLQCTTIHLPFKCSYLNIDWNIKKTSKILFPTYRQTEAETHSPDKSSKCNQSYEWKYQKNLVSYCLTVTKSEFHELISVVFVCCCQYIDCISVNKWNSVFIPSITKRVIIFLQPFLFHFPHRSHFCFGCQSHVLKSFFLLTSNWFWKKIVAFSD